MIIIVIVIIITNTSITVAGVVVDQGHLGADGQCCRDGLLLQHQAEPRQRQTGAAQARSDR